MSARSQTYGTFAALSSAESTEATMATNTKSTTARDDSIDHDDLLKGDIVVGAIAGRAVQQATADEHNLTFLEALRLYPKAVAWSMFFSLGIIMCAFDPQLLGQLYAVPRFQRDFGYEFQGEWIVKASWQTALSMGSPIGQVVGAFCAAFPMEWFGRKVTFGACVIFTAGFVFIQFFARSLPVLLVGELLGGLILGTYATIAPTYASEVCPVALRGVLTSYINLCFVGGQLLANGVIAGTHNLDSHWAYSGPFAAQWFWPLVILIGWPFAPESPWWLVRQNRHEDAEKSLRRLASPSVDVKPTLAMIIETDRLEHELEAGSTYVDCFRKINLRRTEIATGVYCIQVISGIYLVGYTTYFFTLAGLPTDSAFGMGVGFQAVGFVGTLCSWILLVHVGRRKLYNYGLTSLAILLLIIGILDCVPNYVNRPSLKWAQASLMLVWNFCYDVGDEDANRPQIGDVGLHAADQAALPHPHMLSVGPVTFVILCEVSATRVRGKTIAVATATQALLGIIMTIAIPYLLNPDQANARGKVGFFFGGLAVIALGWSYFRVPETRGRTYEELDIMFSKGIKTKDFKSYVVDGAQS